MDRMHSLYLKYTARTVGLDSCLCEVDGTNEPYIHTYQMHFIKLENPESPFLRQFFINTDRNISPMFMVEFQSMQQWRSVQQSVGGAIFQDLRQHVQE